MSASRFLPHATMFKLPLVTQEDLEHGNTLNPVQVACVSCYARFTLKDLLGDELEEMACPRCKVTAKKYWASRPHQKSPP